MGFYINVCPSMVMRIIEHKNRLEDKIKLKISLVKQDKIDNDLKGLLDNLNDLDNTWKEQMEIS